MKPKKHISRNLLVVVSALGDHLACKSNGNRLDTGLPVAGVSQDHFDPVKILAVTIFIAPSFGFELAFFPISIKLHSFTKVADFRLINHDVLDTMLAKRFLSLVALKVPAVVRHDRLRHQGCRFPFKLFNNPVFPVSRAITLVGQSPAVVFGFAWAAELAEKIPVLSWTAFNVSYSKFRGRINASLSLIDGTNAEKPEKEQRHKEPCRNRHGLVRRSIQLTKDDIIFF